MQKKLTIWKVLSQKNINAALDISRHNKAGAGIDGITHKEVPHQWKRVGAKIIDDIITGTYKPKNLKGAFIAKSGTKERRRLSIPSAIDQVILNCLRFELEKLYEPLFYQESYGFRTGRNTQQALQKVLMYMNQSYEYVVDVDIRKFFDTVNWKKLLYILRKNIYDERIISLIYSYIKAPTEIAGNVIYSRLGLPQGYSLSPVLANIYLNEMDWFLQRAGIKFVRYADDLVMLTRSREDAFLAMKLLKDYLENDLYLRLNEDKSSIVKPDGLKYLGYSFIYKDNRYVFTIGDSSIGRIHDRLEKHIKSGINNNDKKKWLDNIGGFNRGTLQYYRYVDKNILKNLSKVMDDYESVKINEVYMDILEKEDLCLTSFIIGSKGFCSFSDWFLEMDERGLTSAI